MDQNGYQSNLSLRGHTANFIKSTKSLIIIGGICGFNKFNEHVYEIFPQVFFILIV
jgi:hypothetical protein